MLNFRFRGQSSDLPPIRVFKGGPGSGFHGHAGRPGEVGGSAAAGGGRADVDTEETSRFEAARKSLSPYLGRPSPKTPTVNTLDEAMALAHKDAPGFSRELESLAERIGGKVIYPPIEHGGVVKSRKSAEGKLVRKTNQPRDLNDLVRATIEFPTIQAAYEGAAKASAYYHGKGGDDTLLQVDDKIATPTDMGYRDVALKVRNTHGSVGEIIISTPEILAIKMGEGHELYEKVRIVEEDAVKNNRPITAQEKAQIAGWKARSNQLYGGAIGRK